MKTAKVLLIDPSSSAQQAWRDALEPIAQCMVVYSLEEARTVFNGQKFEIDLIVVNSRPEGSRATLAKVATSYRQAGYTGKLIGAAADSRDYDDFVSEGKYDYVLHAGEAGAFLQDFVKLDSVLVVEDNTVWHGIWESVIPFNVGALYANTVQKAKELYEEHKGSLRLIVIDGRIEDDNASGVRLVSFFRDQGYKGQIVVTSVDGTVLALFEKHGGYDKLFPKKDLSKFLGNVEEFLKETASQEAPC